MDSGRKWVKILSNVTFFLAIGLSIYLIANFFILRSKLPPGVCPVDRNRLLTYVAIGLALLSFVLSVVEGRIKED